VNLDDQLRAVLDEEAAVRTAAQPDVQRLISGGRMRRRRRNAAWAGGAVLAAVIAVGGGYGVAQMGDADAGSRITDQPSPQPLPESDEPVALEAGTYVVPTSSDAVVASYTITVPTGWETQHGVVVGKNGDEQDRLGIDAFVLDRIRLTDNACSGPDTLGAELSSAADLVAGLRAQASGPRVDDPVAATVGGLPAIRIDLDYPADRALSNCRISASDPSLGQGVLQIWFGYFVLSPAESASVYVVDVSGGAQVFVTKTSDGASAADRAELESIFDSISFQTGRSNGVGRANHQTRPQSPESAISSPSDPPRGARG
jgi:hypothetical protein